MSVGAWIMLIFGAVFLYGGLIVCINKAKKANK